MNSEQRFGSRARAFALVLGAVSIMLSCVVEKFGVPPGVGSYSVEILSVEPVPPAVPGCEGVPSEGSAECPRPFPEEATPVTVRVRATALDHMANIMYGYTGAALVDVRPGRARNIGPAGSLVEFTDGVGEVEMEIVHAFGETRVWIEDCGTNTALGSYSTGVSPVIWFDRPTVTQLNDTIDNSTSPLTPRPTNVCAISGDPRYGLGVNEVGEATYVGYSHGTNINAPPPAMGNFIEIVGCSRAECDAYSGQESCDLESIACDRGPLVVTAVGNEGFYLSDINPVGRARGFNHIYAFNFNYPKDLEVGDVVLSLRGSPVEFAGTTQIGSPVWVRDGVRRGRDLIPTPVHITADEYLASIKTFGRNDTKNVFLEKLEGALVCMNNIAPASTLTQCDVNQNGDMERNGCSMQSTEAPLPLRCEEGMDVAPAYPACDEASVRQFCFPFTEEEMAACGLMGYIPDNPAEYCCERTCYDDPRCIEESSYLIFGQWVGDVYGRYERGDSPPVKIAFISRDAKPEFDPLAFADWQRSQNSGVLACSTDEDCPKDPQCPKLDPDDPKVCPDGKCRACAKSMKCQTQSSMPHYGYCVRRTARAIGNLRQVLAARPVWVIIARTPSDIEIDGTCP